MMRRRFIYHRSRDGEGLPRKHIPSHSGIRGVSCGGSDLGNREERTEGGEEGWRERGEESGMRGEKSELRHLICEAFITVTRVMRHLSVTEICDWLILFHQDPDHLEAFLRAIPNASPQQREKTI